MEPSVGNSAATPIGRNPQFDLEQIDTWLRYLQSDEAQCKAAIDEKQQEVEEYEQLKTKVADLTKRLQKTVFIPIGTVAFIPGVLDHTNEFYTMIGANTFVKKSSHQTVELLDRRTDVLKDQLKQMEEEMKLVKQRKEFAEQIVQVPSEEVEIREPYDETLETPAARRRQEHVSKQEFSEMMSRLDELEMQEEAEGELENGEQAEAEDVAVRKADNTDEDSASDSSTSPLPPPKGVPKKDYERLLAMLKKREAEESSEEDEDVTEEEETDSDDRSLSPVHEEEEAHEPKIVELPPPALKTPALLPAAVQQPTVAAEPQRRKSVQFNAELLGPTAQPGGTPHPVAAPHSILRPTKLKPRVDWQAVEAANRRDQKVILPESKSVFRGEIVERDPLAVLPERPNDATGSSQRVSKFKQRRGNS